MSKTQGRRLANDGRPARRSMVDLAVEASRAVDEALVATPVRLVADSVDHPPLLEQVFERPDRIEAPQRPTAPIHAGRPSVPNRPAVRGCERASGDSAAEMVVQIAKDYQSGVLDHIKAGLSAALDHARDFAETQPAAEGTDSIGRENHFMIAFGAAAAEFRAEALKLLKANVTATLIYTQDLAEARTAAEVVELSGTQARKNCELMLKQADALKSLALAVAKDRVGDT